MRDPKRWIDDDRVSEPIRALLQAGGAPPPMPDATSAELFAVAQALMANGVVDMATGAGAAAKATGSAGLAKAVGAGAASRGAGIGAGSVSKAASVQSVGTKLLGLKTLGTMLVAGGVTSAGIVGYGLFADSAEPRAGQSESGQRSRHRPTLPTRAEPASSVQLHDALGVADATATAAGRTARSPAPATDASETERSLREHTGTRADRRSVAAEREPPDPGGSLGSHSSGPLPSASFTSETLAHEAELLLHAREELLVSPEEALALTEEHRRLHPQGQLGADRELIAIDALIRLGRLRDAHMRADPLIARAPTGIYARRLRQLLDGPNPR